MAFTWKAKTLHYNNVAIASYQLVHDDGAIRYRIRYGVEELGGIAHSEAEARAMMEERFGVGREAGWLDIATAPMDSTHILLRYRWAHREVYVAEGWWLVAAECWVCHGHPGVRAIQWQPLPAPPMVAEAVREGGG